MLRPYNSYINFTIFLILRPSWHSHPPCPNSLNPSLCIHCPLPHYHSGLSTQTILNELWSSIYQTHPHMHGFTLYIANHYLLSLHHWWPHLLSQFLNRIYLWKVGRSEHYQCSGRDSMWHNFQKISSNPSTLWGFLPHPLPHAGDSNLFQHSFIKCILNILESNKGLNLMFPLSTDGISWLCNPLRIEDSAHSVVLTEVSVDVSTWECN